MSGNFIDGWKLEWFPRQLGVHTIEVQYGGHHVTGSPFRCKVYDLEKVSVIVSLFYGTMLKEILLPHNFLKRYFRRVLDRCEWKIVHITEHLVIRHRFR